MSLFSQGICEDGAAILDNGMPLTPAEIVKRLNYGDDLSFEMGIEAAAKWHEDRAKSDFEDAEKCDGPEKSVMLTSYMTHMQSAEQIRNLKREHRG